MRVVILATRPDLPAEEIFLNAALLEEAAGEPLLLHLMRSISAHGFGDFVIGLSDGSEELKDYFLALREPGVDLHLNLSGGWMADESGTGEWQVSLVDTGQRTMNGGRLLRMAYLLRDGAFILVTGDSFADFDLPALLNFHQSHTGLVSMTTVPRPEDSARPALPPELCPDASEELDEDDVEAQWVDAGCYVMEPEVLRYLTSDTDSLESLLLTLSHENQVRAFSHTGPWQCCQTSEGLEALDAMFQPEDAA